MYGNVRASRRTGDKVIDALSEKTHGEGAINRMQNGSLSQADMTSPKNETKDRPLDRYITVLETISSFPDGSSAGEIEALLGLPKSTVNRLVRTLVESGMVQAGGDRRFVLGPRLLRLLHPSPNNEWIETISRHPLRRLAEATSETCFIAKLTGREIRSVCMEAPDTPVRTYVVPGSVMPYNAAASAKAILAWQDRATIDAVLDQHMTRFTEQTLMSKAKLLEELRQVQERGYALDRAEHVEGLATIAFPVQTLGFGVVYAVGIVGPRERILGQALDSLVASLRQTASTLADAIVRGEARYDNA